MQRIYLILLFAALFTACQSEPTLQKYFVEKAEDKNFVGLDIAPSILNLDQNKLNAEQKAALGSFDKMNILAFKAADNKAVYDAEKAKVKTLLKDEKYQELMKFGSGSSGGSLCYVGTDDEHIDEFIVFANEKDTGFAVVRILGDDMNPTGVMTLLSLLPMSNIDTKQLKPLQDILQKK
jgi:hypothetical protein